MKNRDRVVVVLIVLVVAFVIVSTLMVKGRSQGQELPGSGVTCGELPPQAVSERVRVALWNVRNFPRDERPQDIDLGYSRRTNIGDLEDALRGLDADVIGFEEITDPERFSQVLGRAGGDRDYRIHFGSRGGPHGQKIALAWDDARVAMIGGTEEIEGVAVTDRYKPALVATFKARQDPSLEFTVVQVHLAASPRGFSHRRRQYQALADWINSNAMGESRANVIIQGDFNVTGWEGGSYAGERDMLDSLMRSAGMRRSPNSTGCSEYWEGGGGRDGIQVPALLDLVYLKGFEDRQVTRPESWLHCKRLACKELVSIAGREDGTFWDVSDHCPVTFEIH
jgi:endonuclease/exonuclease/phosphatase family metal-dependent hydrolase